MLRELLIGRAANFPKITVEFVPVSYESSQILYKWIPQALEKTFKQDKKVSKNGVCTDPNVWWKLFPYAGVNHGEFWESQRSICTSPCRLVCLSLTAELMLYFYFKILLNNFLTDLLGTFILNWPILASLINLSLISIILRRPYPIFPHVWNRVTKVINFISTSWLSRTEIEIVQLLIFCEYF